MSSKIMNFVDDDLQMLKLYGSMASAIDLPYKCYNKASEYLADIPAQDGCSLLVLDLSMPDIDGFEVIKQFKTLKNPPSLILVSGYDEQLIDSAIRLAKFYGFRTVESITKPFDIDSLSNRLTALVQG